MESTKALLVLGPQQQSSPGSAHMFTSCPLESWHPLNLAGSAFLMSLNRFKKIITRVFWLFSGSFGLLKVIPKSPGTEFQRSTFCCCFESLIEFYFSFILPKWSASFSPWATSSSGLFWKASFMTTQPHHHVHIFWGDGVVATEIKSSRAIVYHLSSSSRTPWR